HGAGAARVFAGGIVRAFAQACGLLRRHRRGREGREMSVAVDHDFFAAILLTTSMNCANCASSILARLLQPVTRCMSAKRLSCGCAASACGQSRLKMAKRCPREIAWPAGRAGALSV